MPYHVIVSRQVLLDGPQMFFTTVTLCLLIRFARSGRTLWLCCAGAGMGLSVLAKEPSVIFCGAVYAFFALSPEIRVRPRALLTGARASWRSRSCRTRSRSRSPDRRSTGGNFLAWQLVRQPNHSLAFYLTAVPPTIGSASSRLAALSLIARARGRRWTWRETLVACWVGVPIAFLELWPVKGFQYLLPLAPVVAVLAADGLATVARGRSRAPTACASRGRARCSSRSCSAASPCRPTRRLPRRGGSSYLAGSGGAPGRPRDGPLHPGARARGRDDADDRPVDGERARVLRPPARLRPRRQPQPARTATPSTGRSPTPTSRSAAATSSTSSGTRSRHGEARTSSGGC